MNIHIVELNWNAIVSILNVQLISKPFYIPGWGKFRSKEGTIQQNIDVQ